MKHTDHFGNAVSGRNRTALDLYDQAVTQLAFYRATRSPPSMRRSRSIRISSWAIASRLACWPPPPSAATRPASLRPWKRPSATSGYALERERMHLDAARAWLSRDFTGAAKLYGDICAEYPRDLLALQIAHLFDFFLGHSTHAARPARAGAARLGRARSAARPRARHARLRARGMRRLRRRGSHRTPRRWS